MNARPLLPTRFSPIRRLCTPLAICAALTSALPTLQAQTPSQPSAQAKEHLQESFGKLPLSFELNRGQAASPAQFLSRGPGYAVYLSPDRAVLQLHKSQPMDAAGALGRTSPQVQSSTLTMTLVGAKSDAMAAAQQRLPGTANYFIGNDRSKWQTGLPTYGRVAYGGVYPGVDLVYYGNQRELEYDFVVAPGANADAIALQFDGATPTIDRTGDLLLATSVGDTRFHKPVVYQILGERKIAVDGSYRIAGGKVGFSLGRYDHTQPLVIDPVLSYLTYLGGSTSDQINGIAVDSLGEAVVIGSTYSTEFPLKNPYSSTPTQSDRSSSMFVSKLNAAGTALIYSTYLGQSTIGAAVATDSAGNAYAFATTNDPNYPVTAGAFQTLCGANYNPNTGARVTGCSPTAATGNNSTALTKLSADGSQLLYSTFLSGNDSNIAKAVVVNSAGEAYVSGMTNAYCPAPPYNANGTGYQAYSCFPVTANAADSSVARTSDTMPFLTKFNAQGSGLVYSTVLANHNPVGHYVSGVNVGGLAIDAAGNAYVTGYMDANYFITTTAGSYQPTRTNGQNTAFVAKFNPAGASPAASLAYSTYLSGTGNSIDYATGIAVDSAGNAIATGYTSSCTWPTTAGAFSTVPGGYVSANTCSGGYLTKLNAAGTGLVWSTYTGNQGANGRNNDNNDAVAVGGDGSVYVVGDEQGVALSPTVNPILKQNESHFTYVKHFSADGSAVVFSSAIGGTTDATSIPAGVVLDAAGNIYIAGTTNSQTWPVTSGAFQATNKTMGSTGFVVKIAPTIASTTALTLPGGTVTAGHPATFTAKVAGPTGTSTIPTGTVTFVTSSTTLGTAALDATGTATYTAPSLNGTTYSITASYAGNSIFSSSTSAAQSLVVAPAAAAVTLTAPSTAAPGTSVTLSVKVTGNGGTPTGTVTFKDGTATLGTATLVSGSATYTSTAFAVGSHSLSVSYIGDSIFAAGTSGTQTLVVAQAPPVVTLTAPSSALVGASVTLSANVAVTSGTPTGTITFKDGSTTLVTVPLASGTASTTTSVLAIGAHTIIATYSGDATFSAATSAASTVTINVPASISFAASPTSLTITRGSSGTVTITGTPVGAYAGTVTFTCGTLPASASCLFAPASLIFSGNNMAQSSTLTISTTSTTARLEKAPFSRSSTTAVLALLLFPITAAFRRRKSSYRGLLLLVVAVGSAACAATLTGCGGSSAKSTTTAAGSYTVGVVATAGSATSTINVTVLVQ